MNGLNGRLLNLPSKNENSKREFLLIYGHHSSIERMQGYVEILSRYGKVILPDIPGFGGMESFYKIGQKPTIDNYADYLAAFVKLKFKRKKFVLVGMSFSVPIYVRMLQKYPEIVKNVEFCVSLVGFVHHEDFSIPNKYLKPAIVLSKFGSIKMVAFLFSKIILHRKTVRFLYRLTADKHGKLLNSGDDKSRRIEMETELWIVNDFRTKMFTQLEMFKVNLCDIQLKSTIHHLSTKSDIYFNQNTVAQHMQIIFSKFKHYISPFEAHAPSVSATVIEIEPLIPKELLKVLKKT